MLHRGSDEQAILSGLDRLVRQRAARRVLDAVAERVETNLEADPSSVLAWEPVSLSVYERPVPEGIRSSWVFALRANSVSGAERHPNSIQRVMSYRGCADLQAMPSDRWISHRLVSRESATLEERWLSIPAGVWHQGVMGADNWVVVSFHTVYAEDLIEERPSSGSGHALARRYIA